MKALAPSAAAAFLLLSAPAAPPDNDLPFTLEELAPGVYAAIDRDARAGANAGFVIGEEAVAVIDAFQYPEAAQRLLAEIRRRTALPIRYVISTHYHIDHVAGNGVFRQAGALVVSHRNVASWIRSENLKFYTATQAQERALVERLPLPDLLLDDAITLRLGDRLLEVRNMPGHTGGDLVVVVPDAKVVFAGDLFWRRVAPSLIDATVSTWIESLDEVRRRPDAGDYTFVPGQGDVATVADVSDFAQYLRDLCAEVTSAANAGTRAEGLRDAVAPAMKEKYGSWALFERSLPQQIGHVAAELAGTKRTPPPHRRPAW